MAENIPFNEYYSSFGPNHQLHVVPDDDLENRNTRAYLEKQAPPTSLVPRSLAYCVPHLERRPSGVLTATPRSRPAGTRPRFYRT